MKIYKIRHKITSLFSRGGAVPSWSKKGKTWNGIGPLKLHILGIEKYCKRDTINWEIIEIEVSETMTSICTADQLLTRK